MKRVVGLIVAGVLVLLPAADASAGVGGPRIKVKPNTDLANHQLVKVRGEGFTPSAPNIVVAECVTGGTTADDCDVINVVFTHAAADGSWSLEFNVQRTINTVNQGQVKCRPQVCSVVGANFDNQTQAAAVPISFAS